MTGFEDMEPFIKDLIIPVRHLKVFPCWKLQYNHPATRIEDFIYHSSSVVALLSVVIVVPDGRSEKSS